MSDPVFSLSFDEVALEQLSVLPSAVFSKIERSLALIKQFPGLGRLYEPTFGETLPPRACRMLTVGKTTKVIYYQVDEIACSIRVYWIGDTRSDPMTRFLGLHLNETD